MQVYAALLIIKETNLQPGEHKAAELGLKSLGVPKDECNMTVIYHSTDQFTKRTLLWMIQMRI